MLDPIVLGSVKEDADHGARELFLPCFLNKKRVNILKSLVLSYTECKPVFFICNTSSEMFFHDFFFEILII